MGVKALGMGRLVARGGALLAVGWPACGMAQTMPALPAQASPDARAPVADARGVLVYPPAFFASSRPIPRST